MENELPYLVAGLPLSIIVLYAFWIYNKHENKVSVGTWFILAYGDILEFGSYFSMTERWWLNLVPAAFAIGSVSTFAYVFFKKRFGEVRRIDIFCIVADIAITAAWGWMAYTNTSIQLPLGPWERHFDSATIVNLLYQCSAVIAFIPMWWSQVEGRELEHSDSWLLWCLAFIGFSVMMTFTHEKWEELVYPFLNIFTHYMIGATAITVSYRLRLHEIAPR